MSKAQLRTWASTTDSNNQSRANPPKHFHRLQKQVMSLICYNNLSKGWRSHKISKHSRKNSITGKQFKNSGNAFRTQEWRCKGGSCCCLLGSCWRPRNNSGGRSQHCGAPHRHHLPHHLYSTRNAQIRLPSRSFQVLQRLASSDELLLPQLEEGTKGITDGGSFPLIFAGPVRVWIRDDGQWQDATCAAHIRASTPLGLPFLA